uniref:Integrase catalytic domain-containing protein n=1 Tax=Meloidogyne incognita TaxID=6306 RepID=A0A914MG20_MELIC
MIYILRFIKVILGIKGAPTIGLKSVSENGPPTAADITLAERYLIKWEQRECSEELQKYKHIIDDQEIIRLQTRITNSKSPEGLIYPILLPKNSSAGKLLIAHIHKNLCHGGVDWTLTEYLTQYWQPRARQAVRSVISECMACRKMNSYKYALPEMPPLPSDRVQQRRPFQSIGIDYAGPTLTKFNGVQIKCWLVLITCLTTRAVYLEPSLDLTALSFINVFRRFISRRGRPEKVLSDNGRNFVLAEKAISSALPPLLAENKIEWKFIPALSPWAGGVYERLIGLAKSCFKRTLGKQILPYDQLSTFIAEVEAALNSRPLTHVSDGEGAPLPLRPIDFIHPGSTLSYEPANKLKKTDHLQPHEQLLAHWKGTLENLDSLWERWRKEYLIMLRDNSKWEHSGPRLQNNSPPKLGDVVLVEEALQPRNTWSLARVEKLNGDPGPIRSVKLRMPNGRVTTRPVNRIYPLEVAQQPTDQTNQLPQQENIPPDIVSEEVREVNQTNHVPPKSTLNMPPFEEEAEEDPPPLIGKQNNIRKENPRGAGSKHGMTARSKVTVAAAIPLVLFLTLSILSPVYASIFECTDCSKCQGCIVHCNKFGVKILAPERISKVQICCSDHCHLFPGQPETDHILPKEMLLDKYECKANFWDTNKESPYDVSVQCSAFHPCQLIDCNFCLELLLNPRCKPKTAAFVVCSILFPFLVLFSCICGAMQRIFRPFGFILKFFNRLLRRQRVRAKIIKRDIIGKSKTAVKKITTNATKEVKKKTREFRQASLSRLARYGILAILISLTILLVNSDTVSVISQSESCRVKNGTRHCHITSSTTLSLLPAGQPNNLLIKDKRGEVLGAVTLTLRSLNLVCNPKTIAYLRSYQINTRSVWRCPTSGSCSGNFCSRVGPKTHIPELAELTNNVGNSGCIESSAVWSEGCGLPTASCYFYRWYAVPMSFDVYELFECPTWDFHINSVLRLTVNDYSKEESVTLIPGWTQHSNNISLTPIAISNPPAPILGTPFLTHGFSVALGKNVPLDLKCPDLASARGFGCNISEEACRECRLISGDTVTCQCREFDAEAMLADPELRLPLTIGRQTFLTKDDTVYVEQTYTPIQIHIQMENFQLITQITESACKVIPKEIRGCYKCLKGVQVDFTCTTDLGNALAYISCADGINFISRCSENGTAGTAAFTYDRSRIDTSCTVKCPGGESNFHLKGELIFIPLSWKERENIQSMSSQKSAAWTLGNLNPFYLLPSLPIIFSVFTFIIILTILIIFYTFVRFKLKLFRKIATQIVPIFILIFLAGGEGAMCPLNKKSVKLQLKNWQIQKNNFLPIQHFKMFFCPTSAQITHFSSLCAKLALAKNKANFCNSKDALWRIIQQAPVRHIKSNKQIKMAIFAQKNNKSLKRMPKIGGARMRKKGRPLGQNFSIAPPNLQSQKLGFINAKQSPVKSFSVWQFIRNSQTTLLFLAILNFPPVKEMQAQPCLVPPVYEPGLTSREYLRKCQEVGYNPDWPRRGQTMAEYLPNVIGRMWPPTWSRELPRRQAEGLLCLLWENLRYRGKRLPNVIPNLSQPAWVTLIQPGETVEDYFARKSQPLVHPRLPCLIIKGGIRGSSRRSRQRARATGKPCWKSGEPHEDYLPLD